VETHSDHLLNGIRVAVHDGQLAPEDAAIHYFERRVVEERFVHGVTSPRLDRDGRIDQWPDGFFDEWENALQKLLSPAG
jgi:predicted ATPase